MEWGGEYSQFLAAKAELEVILPLAVICIFIILFALYGNFKFPFAIALGVIITEPVSALIPLKLSNTPFSVSSVLGLPALMGVSVEVVVILVSFINKLRLDGMDIRTATREAAPMRLRPILLGFFVNPALYLLVAREGDVLQV
jgi:cobalt-zinc-cadmium resistance protein CzcA